MSLPSVKERFKKMPRIIKIFLLKAFLLFVIWQISYHLVMAPLRVPDQFLTNITSIYTAKILALHYNNVGLTLNMFKDVITVNAKKAVGIADPCNALELYVLYIGFLICFPARNLRRLLFTVTGILLIFIANIIRCAALAVLNLHNNNWIDLYHHFIFKAIVYVMIFYLWVLFTRKTNFTDEP